LATGSEAAASFEELDEPRQVNPWWCSDHHMDMRLEHRELDDRDVVPRRSLPEEFFKE